MKFSSLFSLPNILTLVNLFFGCMAVVFIFSYYMDFVPYCIAVCLVADFLDGFAARFTKSSSDIGKQLDSLADVVSFGVVPGAILFQLLFQKYESDAIFYSTTKIYLLSAPAFLVTMFAALRLAKFNVDPRQSDTFIGLATPAMTIFVIGYLLVVMNSPFGLTNLVFRKEILYAIIIMFSLLMVVEIPMFSLKFKSFGWKGNEVVYVFIFLSLILLATLKFVAIPIIIILYVLISIALKLFKNELQS